MSFNVFDMMDEYAKENNVNPEEVFKKPEPTPEADTKPEKKQPWTPDASLLEGLPETESKPIIIDKEDFQTEADLHKPLQNIVDAEAEEGSRESKDTLERCGLNIEDAKRRHGIVKLQIPQGELYARFMLAAQDPDYESSQRMLDMLIAEMEANHPEYIMERVSDGDVPKAQQDPVEAAPETNPEDSDVTKVIIDISQAPNLAFSAEDLEKMRRSRSLELTIQERKTIDYAEIRNIPSNRVSSVLMKYRRKFNDVTAVLPASKYKCTIQGLSYPEILENDASSELSANERDLKIWTMIYDHMYNQSIGKWEPYQEYLDEKTGKWIRMEEGAELPDGVEEESVCHITAFEDFLKRTSFVDQDFLVWKMLCATCTEHELLPIRCRNKVGNIDGKEVSCNHYFEHLYTPGDILDMKSINPGILEDMKTTGETNGYQEAIENYQSSLVFPNKVLELKNSGWVVLAGHASAYDYLYKIQPMMLQESEKDLDRDDHVISRTLAITSLSVVLGILLPDEKTGGYIKIDDPEGIIYLLQELDATDWYTVSEFVKLMLQPYSYKFTINGVKCPKCGKVTEIKLEGATDLLFTLARTQGNVHVALKSI